MKMKIQRQITAPTLLLDEAICRSNIKRMATKASRLGLRFRPHLKTPQSREIARWLRDFEVSAITVSSVKMAAYFANDGWNDITVAFPVNIREIEQINSLAEKIQLHLCVENEEGILALSHQLKHDVGIWIKVNIGNNRTGLSVEQADTIGYLLKLIDSAPQLRAKGFLGHAGHTYQARGQAEIAQAHLESLEVMQQLKQSFPQMEISVGDTPTASAMDSFPGVEEIRPGNFFFYDLMQAQIGACSMQDIAVAVACPVVAKHDSRGEIVIYGGAVHFSKDYLIMEEDTPFYGLVAKRTANGWQPLSPTAYVCRLSQEHGIIKADTAFLKATEIGSLLFVLPIHSCLTANLMKGYMTLEGKRLEMMQ